MCLCDVSRDLDVHPHGPTPPSGQEAVDQHPIEQSQADLRRPPGGCTVGITGRGQGQDLERKEEGGLEGGGGERDGLVARQSLVSGAVLCLCGG